MLSLAKMLLLRDLIRFSTQHRTLYCYMMLSIWIFLLIAGMYKYIASNNTLGSSLSNLQQDAGPGAVLGDEWSSKLRTFKERCTPLSQVTERRDDGGLLEGWRLQGVLLVIRHGDRGPMSHVRAVSSIDCGVSPADALVNRYRSFLHNTTSTSGANHMYWNKVGAFHGFALLPATERSCLLGQLTYKGITQLLRVGALLHQVYAHPLGLLHKLPPGSRYGASSSTPHTLLNSDEVVVYSTRYRRTFQSAMALLFSLLPADKWLALNVRESHSMAFCFTDCACAQAEALRRRLNAQIEEQLARQPTVLAAIEKIGGTLLQQMPFGPGDSSTAPLSDSAEVVDAVLTVLCHDAALPCRRAPSNSSSLRSTEPPTAALELNDVINIDQDDTAANLIEAAAVATSSSEELARSDRRRSHPFAYSSDSAGCIEPGHIAALLSYARLQSAREARHPFYKRIGLLRAYGAVRHIVSYMLKMISGDRTKFVLYSGHDWTLQHLAAALGLLLKDTHVPYASRLAFEVYKSAMHTDYYFRVVFNGRDVTRQIEFCEGGRSLRVTRDSRGNKADLCPIENIIRFLHEDYFTPLNATNFKDACTATQRSNEF